MELTKPRQEQLLYKLLEVEQYITIKELATEFEVSSRTIRRDLDKLESYVEHHQMELIKKPGLGIWLQSSSREKYKLKQELGVVKETEWDSQDRVRWLIKELVFGANDYSIGEIEDKLHISRSTVYNDLDNVEQWLQEYDLSLLKQNHKFLVTGRETNIRLAIVNLMLELLKSETKETIIDLLQEGASIYTTDHQILQEFCLPLDLKFVRDLVGVIEEEVGIVFTTRSLLQLCLYLAVSFKRIENNHEVRLDSEQIKKLKGRNLFTLNKIVASQIKDELGLTLSASEIGFNMLQMLAGELYSADSLATKADIKEQIKAEIVKAVEDLIYYFKYNLEVTGEEEFSLFKNLVLYLRSLYYTKHYQIKYNAPLSYQAEINELKAEYPYLFRMVADSFDILKDRLGIKLNVHQIKEVALILLTVLEQKKRVVKVVVIFDASTALAQLMEARLMRRIPKLQIVDWIYFTQLQTIPQTADFIISTREIDWLDDLIVISPLVKQTDIKRIENKIEVLSDLNTYFGS